MLKSLKNIHGVIHILLQITIWTLELGITIICNDGDDNVANDDDYESKWRRPLHHF